MQPLAILWRRLDQPGHDACRLMQINDGWHLSGTNVTRTSGLPAVLHYWVLSDLSWHTQRGAVHGWIGGLSLDVAITRTGSTWTLTGYDASRDPAVTFDQTIDLAQCRDLDLGFTPATNLLPMRRLGDLPIGQSADVPVVWFDVDQNELRMLPQRYERRSDTTWWYESPTFGYAALLETDANGFVRAYPGLWDVEE